MQYISVFNAYNGTLQIMTVLVGRHSFFEREKLLGFDR